MGWSWNKTTYIQDLAVDDWGFPALLRGLYHWSENPEQYFSLLILANSFCVAASSFFLYQAARKLLEKQYAKIAAIIWGLSTYALFSTVHWLKENFFGAVIVLALYGLLDTCEKLRGRQLLTFWGAAFLTVFFRLAVPFIFLASFCGRFISVDFVKRHILFLAVTGAFLLFILLDPFLRLLGIPGGVEWILTVSTGRIQHIGGGFAFMLLIQCLSALFGPFPNFIGQQASPFFLYNFYLLLKCLLSIYFLDHFFIFQKNSLHLKMANFSSLKRRSIFTSRKILREKLELHSDLKKSLNIAKMVEKRFELPVSTHDLAYEKIRLADCHKIPIFF